MGDRAAVLKARQQLEDLYLGVPDDSVDLTFKDMASFQEPDRHPAPPPPQPQPKPMSTIHEEPATKASPSHGTMMTESPSLDLGKAIKAAKDQQRAEDELLREHAVRNSFKRNNGARPAGLRVAVAVETNSSHAYDQYDDASAFGLATPFEERGGRRRHGIPHSNICALCSNYIYIFRHRCLVCGRVYCRNCVGMGMGEMTEGRKCVECLGRRFSQRYIQRAGKAGCCWRYPSTVKQQELVWAEKGPRRSGERRYGRSGMESRSRSPAMPGTPSRSHVSRPRSPVMPATPTRSHVCNSSTFSPSPHAFPL